MIRSMTGYGKGEAAWTGGIVTVEARSVNHRFCEAVVRLPRGLGELEEDLKRRVQERCARGRVELTVSVSGLGEGRKVFRLDRAAAKQYHRLLSELQREFGLEGKPTLAMMAGFRELVAVSEEPFDDRALKRTILKLTGSALTQLDGMRRREGALLAKDLRTRLQDIRNEIGRIEARAPLIAQEQFARMKARVETLLESGTADPARLSTELAVYADRCDVTEEITRLGAHLVQFGEALKAAGSVGRTLDFLLQEMGREVNTIGSKANDSEVAARVVRIKGELEKIREQVQNIE